EAVVSYDMAIAVYQELALPTHLYEAFKGRLTCYLDMGDDYNAQKDLDSTLQMLEHYRTSIAEEMNRDSFFDQAQGIYDLAIRFAYERLNDPARAYGYSEASRARSLLDSISEGRALASEGAEAGRQIVSPLSLSEIQERMPERAQIVHYAI